MFEKSGTKIRFELHCIMPIDVFTMRDQGIKNLKVLLWLYNQQGELSFLNQFYKKKTKKKKKKS